jgi:hypothetical protein
MTNNGPPLSEDKKMFEDEIRDFAKMMARWIIPGAVSVGYNIGKFPMEMSINSDRDTVNQMLDTNREATSENLKGNAGNKALEALDKIKSNTNFSQGVDSVG